MNRDQALEEVWEILREVKVYDIAEDARIQCLLALAQEGWTCKKEVFVPSSGDGRRGRVDIEARKGGQIVGIEIDRKTPRIKSVVKLNSRKDWLRVLATRGKATRLIPGVDMQIELAVIYE